MSEWKVTSKSFYPLMAIAGAAPCLGVIAWIWTGDWRYAATGLVLTFMCAVIGAAIDARKGKP